MKHSLRGRFPVRPSLPPPLEARKEELIELLGAKLFACRSDLVSKGSQKTDLVAVIIDLHPRSDLASVIFGVDETTALERFIAPKKLDAVIEASRRVAAKGALPVLYIAGERYSIDEVFDRSVMPINSPGGAA